MWYKSIKFQILAVLLAQILALLGIVLASLYLINLRQHDYLILNLTGQLRVITQALVTQSRHYVDAAPRDYASYHRDLGLYNRDLQQQIASFDKIVQALKQRTLKADLVSNRILLAGLGRGKPVPSLTTADEVIYCTWDGPSRQQMDETAGVWHTFRAGLLQALGHDADGPRLEAAADYILLNEQSLSLSTAELAATFRNMMETKLRHITELNQAAIGILIFIGITIVLILYRQVFRPIDRAVSGFRKVAHGELGHQIPVFGDNEIGVMAHTFNHLTQRLATLFRLTDRINQTDKLDNTLRFVYEDFPVFLPVSWVGVIRTSRTRNDYRLDRYYSETHVGFSEHELFPYPGSLFEKVILDNTPCFVCRERDVRSEWDQDLFIQRLQGAGLDSVFYLPLLANPLETAVLVIATDQTNAYHAEHMEFLSNIASQVGHSFEKTIGMESLVISAVKGLAKLAESRDPETGDHLFRMSHYSAIIAEQLALTEKYRTLITPAYVRDILQFAPMHDIGKVGISDSILLKPGKLDAQEMQAMQQHPVIGGDVLRRCEQQMNAVGRSVFQIGIEIAEGHHEKFDGSGYPHQLHGEAIALPARIVAVADVFDALTSKRPYKEAWPVARALEVIRSEAGRHFDPEIVAAFEQALPRILDIYEKHKHIA